MRLTRTARRALLADMSAAWCELNTVLQFIGHGASQGIYGKGRRRKRSGPRLQAALDELELNDLE